MIATLTALIANTNRDAKKRREPYVPADFIPGPAPEPVRRTPAELAALQRASFDAYFIARGGKVKGT